MILRHQDTSFPEAVLFSLIVQGSIKGAGVAPLEELGTKQETTLILSTSSIYVMNIEQALRLACLIMEKSLRDLGDHVERYRTPSIDPLSQRGWRPDDRLQAWLYVHHSL